MKVNIRYRDGEYRVPGPERNENTAYYTDDREDAIGTARLMYVGHQLIVSINGKVVKDFQRNPYPHEHSVRLHDPSSSRYSRFRRVNDQLGKGVSVIFGILRKVAGKAKTEIQAIRFSAKHFSAADVKRWINSHGGRGMGFKIEPATGYDSVGEVYRGNPKRHTWKVWTEHGKRDETLCQGSRAKCLTYYKRHGGERAGLHFGYFIDEHGRE